MGATDEFGFSPTGDRSDIHDLYATMLRLSGIQPKLLRFDAEKRAPDMEVREALRVHSRQAGRVHLDQAG